MEDMESALFRDSQRQRHKRCPVCSGCVYPPSYYCIRCGRDKP